MALERVTSIGLPQKVLPGCLILLKMTLKLKENFGWIESNICFLIGFIFFFY